VASGLYTGAYLDLLAGVLSFTSADIRCTLLEPTYTFSAAHTSLADVLAHETNSSLRQALTSLTAVDNASPTPKRKEFNADHPSWAGPVGAARSLFLYVHNATASLAQAVAWLDFGATQALDGRPFIAHFSAQGAFAIDYFAEDFNRANNAVNLGSADWTDYWFNWAGISSNQAYSPGGAVGSGGLRDQGVSTDYSLRHTLAAGNSTGNNFYLLFHTDDHAGVTYCHVQVDGANDFSCFETVSGTPTSRGSSTVTRANGDAVVVVVSNGGATLKCYYNGTLKFTATLTQRLTNTYGGFGLFGAAARSDNFRQDGPWHAYDVTPEFETGTASPSAWTPEPGGVLQAFARPTLIWTPEGGAVIDTGSAEFDVNGVTYPGECVPLSGGAVLARSLGGSLLARALNQIAARIEASAELNETQWTSETRKPYPPGYVQIDEAVARPGSVAVPVDVSIRPGGLRTSSPVQIDYSVGERAGGLAHSIGVQIDYQLGVFEIQRAVAISAGIGEPFQDRVAFGATVEGVDRTRTVLIGASVSATARDRAIALGMTVGRFTRDRTALISAVIGEHEATRVPISHQTRPVSRWLWLRRVLATRGNIAGEEA
jgi:hypothetical protein